MRTTRSLRTAFLLFLAISAAGCGGRGASALQPSGGTAKLIVIGVDGAEWRVIRKLWDEGELPNLKALVARGASSSLATDYGVSPVIWTTMATGVAPARNGITGFVVPTPNGDLPLASTLRRVPAIWNMASASHRRVAVIGWWASWPAEAIDGVVISDRVLWKVADRVYPREELPAVLDEIADAKKRQRYFPGNGIGAQRDEILARYAVKLAGRPFDLLLVYLRSVDINSHKYWKYFEPGSFPAVPAAEIEKYADRIPKAYESVDAVIGDVLEAAGPEADVIVISDHGFAALDHERIRIRCDLDLALERLGYLTRTEGGVDFSKTKAYTYATAKQHTPKLVRFALAGREPGGTVTADERAGLRVRLAADLARLKYASGKPVFAVRDADSSELERGGDFAVDVLTDEPTRDVLLDGAPLKGVIESVTDISGGHKPHTPGIFIAAGPDVDPKARLDGISIHDIAPTILAAMGLPVAKDFDGRAYTNLFTERFRTAHPLQTIASWGETSAGEAKPSEADKELLNELRSLGYIQ